MGLSLQEKGFRKALCEADRHHAHNAPEGGIKCCGCGAFLTVPYAEEGPHDDAGDHDPTKEEE